MQQLHAVGCPGNAQYKVPTDQCPVQVGGRHTCLHLQYDPLFDPIDHVRAVATPETVGIDAIPAVERIIARPAIERVIATATLEAVRRRVSNQQVRTPVAGPINRRSTGQPQILQVPAEDIGCRSLHRIAAFVQRLCHVVAIHDVGVMPCPAHQAVPPCPSVKRVITTSAPKRVIAPKARHQIRQRRAVHRVRRRSAAEGQLDQRFHAYHRAVGQTHLLHRPVEGTVEVVRQRHAVCGAGDAEDQVPGNPHCAQVGLHHPGPELQDVQLRRGRIIGSDHIRAIAAPEAVDVIVGATVESVGPRPAVKRVITTIAPKRVIARKARHQIRQRRAVHRVRRRRAAEGLLDQRFNAYHRAVGQTHLLHRLVERTVEVVL